MAESTQQVTPTLYSFYGKQYDYNDLAKAADSGLNDYLITLERGVKDSDKFKAAYADMMSGIKDGTITFGDGHFTDSKGRYTNADKEAKDYYGLIANYIYDNMGKSNVYEAPISPEEARKIKWDDNSVKTALMREIYNSDTAGNLQDFLELDDAKNGVRGITNRSTRLANAFQSIADNWDNTFSGYSDNDKNRYRQLLGEAATALRDGTINAGDYLALSRAIGGVDFRSMLATGSPTSTATPDISSSTTPDISSATSTPSSTYKLKRASLNADGYSATDINYMTGLMSKVKSTKGLINILRNSFYNRNYKFARDPRVYAIFKDDKISSKAGITATLNALNARGVLKQADPSNPNLMYIPGLRTKRGTAWVWDKSSNQIAELQVDNIPYLKARLSQVTSHKKGGVLYAEKGAETPYWYSSINDYDKSKYGYSWGSTAYGMDKDGNFIDAFGNANKGYNQNRYTTDSGYRDFSDAGKNIALGIENAQNYKDQTSKILSDYDAYINASDKSGFNESNNLFLRYTKWYDSQQTNSANRFWNGDQLNSNWTSQGKSYYGNTTGPVTDIKTRINQLRNDQMVGIAHNNFKAEGTRYFYKDKDGNQHWVDPEVAKNYQKKEGDPTKTQDGFTTWSDYELIGPAQQKTAQETPQGDGTQIDRTEQTQKPSKWNELYGKIKGGLNKLAPLASEAARMGLSIHTNNKLADILRQHTKLGLYNPWEYHTPITGDFGQMQFKFNQAAQTRSLGDRMASSTSDASTGFAAQLDANRQASSQETEGYLADNKERQRTTEVAQQHAQQAIQVKNNIANKNVDKQVDYDEKLGNIEAQRLNANWQSKDNFIANNISAPLKEQAAYDLSQKRTEEANKKAQKLQFDLAPLARQQQFQSKQLERYYTRKGQDLSQDYNSKLLAWQKVNGEDADYTQQDFYKNYIKASRELQNQMYKDQYDMSVDQSNQIRTFYDNLYNNQYTSNFTSNPFGSKTTSTKVPHYQEILRGAGMLRKGGKIKPHVYRTLNLLGI